MPIITSYHSAIWLACMLGKSILATDLRPSLVTEQEQSAVSHYVWHNYTVIIMVMYIAIPRV